MLPGRVTQHRSIATAMRSACPARLITVEPTGEHVTMAEHAPPRPKQGPASYFPATEEKHGRSIAQWQQIIAGCGLDKHTAIAGYSKSGYGMGHGHANALAG
jgi:hypothetical protein